MNTRVVGKVHMSQYSRVNITFYLLFWCTPSNKLLRQILSHISKRPELIVGYLRLDTNGDAEDDNNMQEESRFKIERISMIYSDDDDSRWTMNSLDEENKLGYLNVNRPWKCYLCCLLLAIVEYNKIFFEEACFASY